MFKKCMAFVGAASLSLLIGSAVSAQMRANPPQTQNPPNQASNPRMENPEYSTSKTADQEFAAKAAQGGVAEVKMGQLAQEKGSNEAVKQFGKRMVEDHKQANDKLKEVAQKENINLPADMSSKEQSNYDKLSKLSGPAFDKEYAKMMVSDHTQDVSEFQKEARNGKDQNLKSFASETVSTLQDHLQQAKQMQQQVQNGNNGSDQH